MAKSTYLLALFVAVVVCAEAIRIDIPERPTRRGRFISKVITNDPRCLRPTGRFAHPDDCTRYIKCVNGRGQERKCLDTMKFDSREHCTYNKNADCGKSPESGPLNDAVTCPEPYGYFPDKSDCHKYIKCVDNIPQEKVCDEGYYYSDSNSGCIKGECPNQEDAVSCPKENGIFPVLSDCHKYIVCVNRIAALKTCLEGYYFSDINSGCIKGECPNQEDDKSVCVKRDQPLPDKKNCRKYIKCVNFKASKKDCPPGKAFDPRKLTCTKEQLKKCNNSVLNVLQDQ